MAERNDNRFSEDAMIAFAMYCDANALTWEERDDLVDAVYDALCASIQEESDDTQRA